VDIVREYLINLTKGFSMIPETITIDETKYVRADTALKMAERIDGLEYKIVRTYAAGVFAGYVKEFDRATRSAVVLQARRIWMWKGAASLSQLAVDGTSCPSECKFPCEVSSIELLRVEEILSVTDKAQKSIKGVSVWAK